MSYKPLDPVTACCAKVYGVDYHVFGDQAGGMLYVTQFGLPLLQHIDPRWWFDTKRYATHGQRLTAGTGTVYRLGVTRKPKAPLDLVIKFSRFAQDVPLDIRSTFGDAIDATAAERARFLDPFQEFGLLREMRRSIYGPPDLRIYTKRPLAIYKAPRAEPTWKLGRKTSYFERAVHELNADQASSDARIALEIDHVYVMLFHWVKGLDLKEARDAGLIEKDEVEATTQRVADELIAKGFMVLDHKPQHVIVRPQGNQLLRKDGELHYALVDFELLERTQDYKRFLVSRQK